MVLDNYRSSLNWWLVPLAKALRHIHPDVFTWLSLIFAVAGGVLFWQSSPTAVGLALLMGAWVCVLLNSVFDLLDGQVAKITGQASARGDYLDHSVDRFSDSALLVGIGLSPWARPTIALAAVAGTLLASYMGTQAQAVGLRRHYGGILGRADRMVLLLAAPLVQFYWNGPLGRGPLGGGGWPTSFLEWVLVYFAVLGLFTTVQRFVSSLRALS
ncbi:MAG: CDP-alcohol phosphatidyltransferase family protein [Thermoplasmatota archaeon]